MTNPRRFRLDVVGEYEDRPRLLRAYGRVRGAELAVVLRPTEQRAVFVVLGKEGCTLWKQELEPGEKRFVGKLKLGKRTEIQVGAKLLQIAGELPRGLVNGQVVPVAVKGERVRVISGGDSPRVGLEVSSEVAVAKVKVLQRGVPTKGPSTLRGRWMGALIWDGHQPSIELKRKLAAYGTLVCRSAPEGWSWSFERAKRWYSGEKREEGAGYESLMDAIEAGLTAAMLLVREACGVRDTSRRAALDEVWAERHPLPTPKERVNPVEKLGTKKGCACKAKDPVTGRPEVERLPRERGESAYGYARRLVSEARARIGEGHHRVAEELLKEAEGHAASLSGSKAQRVYEYVDHVRGKLAERAAPEADATKDAVLIDAFRDAVASALS